MTSASHDWLAQRAQRAPDQLALLTDDVHWTFADLHRRAAAAATLLASHGVGQGDRVAVLARNCPAFVLALHAVPRAGAALAPLNLRLAPPELRGQLAAVAPRLLLADADHLALAERLAREAGGITPLPLHALDVDPPPAALLPPLPIAAATLHSIVFTSGSGGRPKGVMLSHGNLHAAAVASAQRLDTRAGDRWLACLPLFHVGGLAIPIRSAVSGFAVVLHPAFDAAAANRAIDEQGVTVVSLVSVMLERLLRARGGRPVPAAFRCALLGGGPAPLSLIDACVALGLPLAPSYGLTEAASQVATLLPSETPHKRGAAGRPLPGVRLRISGDGGRDLGPHQPGEILLQGPTVMAGYYGEPAASARALAGGWLHTGDIGWLDEDGYLSLLGRRDALIISGGENVAPAEVEAVLEAHPAVAEAGVIGLPDPQWGQRPAALVVLHDAAAADAAALQAFCAERLAAYKRPAQIRFLAALPRSATGKLQRARLRDLWSGDARPPVA